MGGPLQLLFVFAVAFSSALAQCTLNEVGCCLSEFSGIITTSGIHLTEQNLAGVCTVGEETIECLDLFFDQCIQNETNKVDDEAIVNRSIAFITEICPPTSDFMTKLMANEKCIANTTHEFQTCYNKTVLPKDPKSDEDHLQKDCCEYKELRDCAVQTVKNSCGETASHLVHEEVVHMNGAVLESLCIDMFSKCSNSAVMLASTAFYVMYSVAILKYLL